MVDSLVGRTVIQQRSWGVISISAGLLSNYAHYNTVMRKFSEFRSYQVALDSLNRASIDIRSSLLLLFHELNKSDLCSKFVKARAPVVVVVVFVVCRSICLESKVWTSANTICMMHVRKV